MIQFLCRANYQDQPSRPSCWFAFLGPLTSTTSAVIFWVDLFAFIRNMFEHILLIPVPSTSHRSKLSSRNKNLLVRNSCITFIQSIFHLTLDRRWLTTCWLLTSLMKCESLGHCKTTLKVLIKCWYCSVQADSVLTGEELRRIFQVSPGDSLPEYEVVTIHHRRQRRSADSQTTHQVQLLLV